MKKIKHIKLPVAFFLFIITMSSLSLPVYGQPEHPPRPVSIVVSVIQYLNFGSFYHYGTGGSVTINSTGSRSLSGDVVPFTGSFSAGLVTISGNKGTVVSLIIAPATLNMGLNFMRLDDFTTDPVSVILTADSPATTSVSIGGTLYVGESSNPPGNYSGIFSITVMQE